MSETLADALRHVTEKLRSTLEDGNEVAIITHLDGDGITAGSILGIALNRMGARYSVRAISGMNPSVIERMKNEGRDFYVITDLGGGWASNLKEALGSKWAIIDHHQIPKEEILTDDNEQILNPWKYGIDGGSHVSAGGMAYMVANSLNSKNRDLSALALVSAIADRQDQGKKKSFIGLNADILKTAQSLGLVTVDLDIMLTGRETKPLHEALAHTCLPFIEGLSWNPDACYALVSATGVKLKENGGRWRVPTQFAEEEKSRIVEEIIKFAAGSNKRIPSLSLDDLIGYVYTIVMEDERSQLRDARDFSIVLNACGRTGMAGVGVALCMGDRNTALGVGDQIMNTYRTTLGNYISRILSEKWRLVEDGDIIFVIGDNLVDEDMLGAVSSLLSSSVSHMGRLLFVRTLTNTDTYRFSSRKSLSCNSGANLGLIMRNCSKAFSGTGGGHSAAAGCRIPISALDDFIVSIKAAINDPKFGNDSSSSS